MDVNDKLKESVRVIVRCRPMNKKEAESGHECCVCVDESNSNLEIKSLRDGSPGGSSIYTFDAVYGPSSTQKQLYEKSFFDVVQSVLLGFNGTIFAYGQTGTGKTFTIQGEKDDPELRGLMPNSVYHIFDYINESKSAQFLVRVSYLEVYKEEIRDILKKDSAKRLQINEKPDRGDLSTVLTKNVKEVERVMNIGNNNRSVGATNMNEQSSRSHALFILTVESSEVDSSGQSHIRVGKLNLVDLAGSERQGKSRSEGERFKEATKINLGLSTLGNVISALVDDKCSHVPYRDSKLTRLLQDSLGGNAKTVMVANIGPSSYHYDETINTLRYASRAKHIKNTPKINIDLKDALLQQYHEEILRLKQILDGRSKLQVHLKESGNKEGAQESDDSEDHAAAAREQQQKMATEKEGIINDQNMVAEEKTRLLEELKDKDRRIGEELAQTAELEVKLRKLESKLLGGGGVEAGVAAVEAQTRTQDEVLAQHKKRLAAHQRHEHRMRRRVRAEADNVATLQEGFSSLNHEIDVYTSKLKKLYNRVQRLGQEIKDIQDAHITERQKQEQTQEQLMKEIKLNQLILDNFIPPEEQKKIEDRASFDSEKGTWNLKPLTTTITTNSYPSSCLGLYRPMCQYARLAACFDPSMRYCGKNILHLSLMPLQRSTMDYQPPEVAPQIVAALEAALQAEEDLELDGRSKPPKYQLDSVRYPESRGLIPK
ncbi:hypothetical protein Aperf_G00000129441 [Anoplocephala perfoliata]